MAKRPKSKTVSRFGGAESIGSVREEGNLQSFKSGISGEESKHSDVNWDAQSLEVQSDTKLEDDVGYGGAAIVRMFEFAMNLEAFRQAHPTKQDLFNYHHKGIEIALWRDGMKVIPEVNPRIILDEKNKRYRIFVGAQPQRGHILREQPQTLRQLVHGN